MKGASSAQVLRHGVFAVAVGVVGAAASVVLCLVVGWAYDLVCAHGWLLYLLPIFAVASLLLYRALRLPLDTTTHTVINDICADRSISPALAPGILLGTALSILGGASVGPSRPRSPRAFCSARRFPFSEAPRWARRRPLCTWGRRWAILSRAL